MLRLRWFDPETKDHTTPLAWTSAALITSTLFVNFAFCYLSGDYLWIPGTLPAYGTVVLTGALLIAGLFFTCPALACARANQPLFTIIEYSFGSVPAWAVRLCCTWFLIVWIGDLVAWPASRFLTSILRRWDVPIIESSLIAVAVLAFLFTTGLQSFRTSVKLAFFTNKLGLAILIAALIRVRDGLPIALKGFPAEGQPSALSVTWHNLSLLAFFVGPVLFLAGDFGYRLQSRKQVLLTAQLGIVLPICVTGLLVGIIDLAAHASGYYQPSLNPTIAMALWSKAAGSALPGRLMIATITIFGAIRFGARAFVNSVSMPWLGRRSIWVLLACLSGIIVWCAVHPFAKIITLSFRASAGCLVVVAAVVTADFVSKTPRAEQARKVDWGGFSALVSGLGTAFYIDTLTDPWWQPGLLPSYGVGFTTCLLARVMQRKLLSQPQSPAPDPLQ